MDIASVLFSDEAVDNEWAGETLKLGRCGEIDARTMNVVLERMWRWPRAFHVVGVGMSENGQFTLKRAEVNSLSDPQHGKSGERKFNFSHLANGSLIEFTNVQGRSQRFDDVLIYVQDGLCARVDIFPEETQNELYKALFPDGFSKFQKSQQELKEIAELSRKLAQSIEEDREKVREEEELEVDGLKAKAMFRDYHPGRLATLIVRGQGGTEDSTITLHTVPIHFVVDHPYVKAATAEEAIAAAKDELARRAEAASAAKRHAEEAGLPTLKGTERQVAWALQIRAQLIAKNPADRRIKQATTARFWIENRDAI